MCTVHNSLVWAVMLGICITTIAAVVCVITWCATVFICSAIYEKINTHFGGIRRDETDLSEASDSNNRHRSAATALSNNGRQQSE